MTARDNLIALLSDHLADMEPLCCQATYIGGDLDGEVIEDFPWTPDFHGGEYLVAIDMFEEGDDMDVDEPCGVAAYEVRPVPSDGKPAVHLIYGGWVA